MRYTLISKWHTNNTLHNNPIIEHNKATTEWNLCICTLAKTGSFGRTHSLQHTTNSTHASKHQRHCLTKPLLWQRLNAAKTRTLFSPKDKTRQQWMLKKASSGFLLCLQTSLYGIFPDLSPALNPVTFFYKAQEKSRQSLGIHDSRFPFPLPIRTEFIWLYREREKKNLDIPLNLDNRCAPNCVFETSQDNHLPWNVDITFQKR